MRPTMLCRTCWTLALAPSFRGLDALTSGLVTAVQRQVVENREPEMPDVPMVSRKTNSQRDR
jgi:hypothetical protein